MLFTVFAFKTAPQDSKATISGSTIIQGGNQEDLFMVGNDVATIKIGIKLLFMI